MTTGDAKRGMNRHACMSVLNQMSDQDRKGPRWMPWHWSRRRTRLPAKSPDELEISVDSGMSEWGNPPAVNSGYPRRRKGTQGTETSQYLEEKKEKSIPSVAASEHGGAQTAGFIQRGCRTTF